MDNPDLRGYIIRHMMDIGELLTISQVNSSSKDLASRALFIRAKKNFPDLTSIEGRIHPSKIIARIKRVHELLQAIALGKSQIVK